MENEEMLEQTNEEVEAETTEENEEFEEGEYEELTDSSNETADTQAEEVKTLRDLLKEHPEYQEELNEKIIKPRLDRKDREHQREMSKFKRTKDLLNLSFESDDMDYINDSMESYLREQGYEVPEEATGLSEEEYEILGNAEANKIIELGEDAIIDELDRLKEFEYEDLSSKEKYVYKRLYEKLDENKKMDELTKEGIDPSILKDDKFKEFRKKFSKDTDVLEIVDMYEKFADNAPKPAKIGSLKSNTEPGLKEFYTDKEISNMSLEDLDKPGVWEAVRKSMTSQKK